MSGSVICFGEVLWDVDSRTASRTLGGAPANVAFHLHQQGIPVQLVSALGRDELGAEARKLLVSHGLDLSLVQRNRAATGVVSVTENSGRADYVIRPGSYDHIGLTRELSIAVQKASLLCFGSLIQRAPQSRNTLFQLLEESPKLLRLLDINLRKGCYSAQSVRDSLERASILKLNSTPDSPNEGEDFMVSTLLEVQPRSSRQAIEAILGKYPNIRTCLVTRGAAGVDVYEQNIGLVFEQAVYPTDVVSVVGAGDAFTAGYIYGRLNNLPLEECVDRAMRMAAVKVGKKGAMAVIGEDELRAIGLPMPVTPDLAAYKDLQPVAGRGKPMSP